MSSRSTPFGLVKADGSPTQTEYRFARLRLSFEGGEITAGLAYSFRAQGIPMRAYAEKVRELYDSA